LFEKDKNTFVRMVEGNDIKAIQDIFGPGNFNIAEQMAEKIKPLRVEKKTKGSGSQTQRKE
jgi:hypothetical protein